MTEEKPDNVIQTISDVFKILRRSLNAEDGDAVLIAGRGQSAFEIAPDTSRKFFFRNYIAEYAAREYVNVFWGPEPAEPRVDENSQEYKHPDSWAAAAYLLLFLTLFFEHAAAGNVGVMSKEESKDFTRMIIPVQLEGIEYPYYLTIERKTKLMS